ncbi:transcriptional repressor TCF25-domain-containing protein [Catenaria anguillulae PL171]|uniref:Transcriptional repressor TCF25-domain-containing protein n=1 Tax=Catenaria anguillulae PL171 TaxID=765915 RepID=A0A1Y2HB31_9FUNG|nr:transcriptional repressor TCF25-domain-containing protein [Catenaria anguillulae PL171]
MSGRAYRRLLKEKEELAAAAAAAKLNTPADADAHPDPLVDTDHDDEVQGSADHDDDDDNAPPAAAPKPFNPFALLMADDDDDDDDDDGADGDDHLSDQEPPPRATSAKKNKKKKNKKAKANNNANQKSVDDFEVAGSASAAAVVASSLPGSSSSSHTYVHTFKFLARFAPTASFTRQHSSHLTIDPKHLDPDTELARLFGSSVVRDAQRNNAANDQDAALLAGAQPAAGGIRRNRNRARNQQAAAQPILSLRKSTLAGTPDPSWPPYHLMGLHTRKLRVPHTLLSTSTSSESPDTQPVVEITAITHTPTYQRLHSAYLTSALSGDPNALLALRHQAAYHPDTLLRLAHVATMYSQPDQAKLLLRQCLYALDRALHVQWAPIPPRMPYLVPNNRIVHLALLAQVTSTARMAGGRTAVEVAKLLLALDPEADPLAMRDVLPALAVRARESAWVMDWMDSEARGQVDLRPHWVFSKALALWQMDRVDEANSLLERAVRQWPAIARVIVPSVTVVSDTPMASAAAPGAFAGDADEVSPTALPPVVHVKSIDVLPPQLDAPDGYLPVFRHIVATDIQPLAGRIPAEYRTGAYMNAIDPMPPTIPSPLSFDGKEVFEDGALAGLEQQLMQAVQGGMGLEAVRELLAALPESVASAARRFIGLAGGENGQADDQSEGRSDHDEEGEESEWEDYAHLLNPAESGADGQEQDQTGRIIHIKEHVGLQ